MTIEAAIIQSVEWAEHKLVDAFTTAQRKDMHIFDEDPSVQSQFDEAAIHLNKTGCLIFQKTVYLFKKFAKYLSVVESGKLLRIKPKPNI